MQKSNAIIFILIFLLANTVCNSQIIRAHDAFQDASTYAKLDSAMGDLDQDGVSEKVIVYDTEKVTDMGTERLIRVLKNKNGTWVLWYEAIGAVLPSLHGGMMGDPFEDLAIERNCIVIKHFGGSRHKWNYTHRYRFQHGAFELIGATIIYGSPCDYFETLDYNLSTGKILYSKETEDCDTQSSKMYKDGMILKPKNLPKMNGFYPGNNEIIFPKSLNSMFY